MIVIHFKDESSNPPCHKNEAKKKKDICFIQKVITLELHIVFLSFHHYLLRMITNKLE
jgi:hypothetical protein